jgi:hypothetical protein
VRIKDKPADTDAAGKEKEMSKKDKTKTLMLGCVQPVLIHGAMALKDFVGVLVEHCDGKWLFWPSRRILVVPVYDYARKVQTIFHD